MTRKTFLLVLCAIAGLVLGAGQAQAKTDFSGEWKLNVAKSDFGPMPAPDKMTMKIDHKEPNINVKQSQSGGPQGDTDVELKYTTDGKETTNTLGPIEAKSTAVWDGDALVIDSKLNLGGADVTFKSKWTLSTDGKTFTNAVHVVSPQGEIDLKYVLEK